MVQMMQVAAQPARAASEAAESMRKMEVGCSSGRRARAGMGPVVDLYR